jgi:hypothetical protein
MRRLDGWIKDPISSQDLLAVNMLRGLPLPTLPEKYLCTQNPPLMNQGNTSECVAFGFTLAEKIHELIKGQPVPKFDPHALYLRCKEKDGIPNIPGTYPRVCCDIMLHEGMPVEGAYASCLDRFFNPRPPNFDLRYRLGGYWRIVKNDTDFIIKQILMQFGPIDAASTWYEEWDGLFKVFPEPKRAGGGHNYVLGGWDDSLGWLVLNSWGPLWGTAGIAWMPYSMFREVVLPEGDVWKLQDFLSANRTLRRLLPSN